ncbi:MAG: aminotransferase class V-fold PLP-dependent enzyme [Desulfitobacteriaceae bacterium]|nr:aminotransferase class V-fold PLP-dependent enzyme [Desulfitobacteriaceae bacterium]MDD4751887.1 aminotransferase class V-fold PLP-dependent enzyme [Desulfitobacteriaceae bacterium]
MIYFDNAATTWPKPSEVKKAIASALDEYGANPGRGSYEMALKVSRLIFETRAELASLFNIKKPERIVFTANATESTNLALKGFLNPGDHVIFTSLEHNAIYRPLKALEKRGVKLTMVQAESDGTVHPEMIARAVRSETVLLAVSHVSNVTGTILPIEEFAQIVRLKNIKMLVDVAQSAGFLDIDVEKQGIDLLAFPGHKGLYGPTGIGGLYIGEGINLTPLKEGGTGSKSQSWEQPDTLPDRFESGTINTLGIAGLRAGVEFLKSKDVKNIREHEWNLTKRFLRGLTQIEQVVVYGPKTDVFRAPVVSFNIKNCDPGEVSFMLDKMFGIAARSGFHCAPLTHRTIGTEETGTIRFSFGNFNTIEEIDAGLDAIKEIVKELETGTCGELL